MFRPLNSRLLKGILAAGIILSMPLQAARTVPAESSRLQTEIDAINLQLEYLKLKVSDSNRKTRQLESSINAKKKDVTELEAQINQLSTRQIEITARIDKISRDSAAVQEHIHSLLERYRARLVQLHKIRQGTLLGSVFSAKNLNSFLNRYQMVKYLLQSDKMIFEELKKQNQQQKKLSEELFLKQQQLEAGRAELDRKQKKLASENAALKAMLSTVLLEKKLLLNREKNLNNARNNLENEIAAIEKSVKKSDLETELSKTPDKPAARQVTHTPLPDEAPEAAKLMGFIWPIYGAGTESVLSDAGSSKTAIQIAVKGETEILAAARGKVLYKGTISGLGNVVILGHNRGFSSVYARLDDMWVGLGEIIDRGAVIGRIVAGRNTSLLFEIRFGGKKQPPLDYLPR